jgi:hypothetical protein
MVPAALFSICGVLWRPGSSDKYSSCYRATFRIEPSHKAEAAALLVHAVLPRVLVTSSADDWEGGGHSPQLHDLPPGADM